MFDRLRFIGLVFVAATSLPDAKGDEADGREPVGSHSGGDRNGDIGSQFHELLEAGWEVAFEDPGNKDWRQGWTLDGKEAEVRNGPRGMEFSAGPEAFNDAHHAVLWTKQSFKGDVKIEYEFTRLDREHRMVTILYVQATGSGEVGFDRDISRWAERRSIPSMRKYFQNMHTYHISYAAFDVKNDDPHADYIRGRRYLCGDLKGTELVNEYTETGLFRTGIPYKITVIKELRRLFMRIEGGGKSQLCTFENRKFPMINEGRIGLRHMYTRSARYKDFRVSVRSTARGT